MHTGSTTNRSRAAAIATTAVALVVLAGTAADAQIEDVPPWDACQVRIDGAAAIDLGPLLGPYTEPGPEVTAALPGVVPVGTDCSAYDLPL